MRRLLRHRCSTGHACKRTQMESSDWAGAGSEAKVDTFRIGLRMVSSPTRRAILRAAIGRSLALHIVIDARPKDNKPTSASAVCGARSDDSSCRDPLGARRGLHAKPDARGPRQSRRVPGRRVSGPLRTRRRVSGAMRTGMSRSSSSAPSGSTSSAEPSRSR